MSIIDCSSSILSVSKGFSEYSKTTNIYSRVCERQILYPDFGICKVVLDAVSVSSGKLLSDVHVISFILILPVCVIVVDLGVPVPALLVSRPFFKEKSKNFKMIVICTTKPIKTC